MYYLSCQRVWSTIASRAKDHVQSRRALKLLGYTRRRIIASTKRMVRGTYLKATPTATIVGALVGASGLTVLCVQPIFEESVCCVRPKCREMYSSHHFDLWGVEQYKCLQTACQELRGKL